MIGFVFIEMNLHSDTQLTLGFFVEDRTNSTTDHLEVIKGHRYLLLTIVLIPNRPDDTRRNHC